ncbi:hypothetical protein [uncultured Draconibacterium sp.]|uniref:hypothetical protein n=1 Tax=uncultured Draconibacterium sp. TaxID=1573823 RepID=UPI003217B730
MSILAELHKDLLDFSNLHDTEKKGLIDQWYRHNFLALSCALKYSDGIKLLLNVENFKDFEKYSKKLFLFADTLVLRDIKKRTQDEFELIQLPETNIYDKKYEELEGKRIPPIHIPPPQAGMWTSSKIKLNDGNEVPLAVKFNSYFPSESYDWMLGSGKQYLQTGQIVYAPFIPPIEVEQEFLKQGVNMPSLYDTQPLFYKDYDWLNEKSFASLLMLNLPTLDNVDIATLNEIKNDNYDSFKLFRNNILDSVQEIKSKFGTEDFLREIKYIQRNKIDDNLDKLEVKLKKIQKMRTLRQVGACIGLAGVNIVGLLGLSSVVPITGLAGGIAGMVAESIQKMKENSELEENPSYFIWKIKNISG